jgi:hypothetical protein
MNSAARSSQERVALLALWLLLCTAVLALVACGGDSNSTNGLTPSVNVSTTPVKALAVRSLALEPLAVATMTKVGERRLARTRWQYTFRVSVTNHGANATGVSLNLDSVPAGTTISDGNVVVGDVAFGATVTPTDTVTIEQDRLVAFDITQFRWSISVQTAVSIDPTVPAAATAAVRQVLSPQDKGSVGGVINLPAPGNDGETMLLALDGAGKMRLAAFARSGATTLSLDSTAIALVRLIMGSTKPADTSVGGDAVIRSVPGYAALVEALRGAALDAVAPADSLAVGNALVAVVTQVMSAINAGALSPALATARALAFTPPTDFRGLPYKVISWPALPVDLPVGVTGGTAASVDVLNSMPIAWSAVVTDSDGTELDKAVLPPTTLLPVLLGNIKPWWLLGSNPGSILADFKPTTLAAAGGKSFNLTIQQDEASRIETLSDIVARTVSIGFAVWRPTSCSEAILKTEAKVLLKANYKIYTGLSAAEAFTSQMTVENISGVLAACPIKKVPEMASFIKPLAAVFSLLSKTAGVYNAFTVPSQIALAGSFWYTDDVTRGICRDARGDIRNCARRFVFEPIAQVVTKGTVVRPAETLQTLGADDKPTGTPAGLRYSVAGGESDPTLQLGEDSGQVTVTAKALGEGSVKVLDPITGAVGQVAVSVVAPLISPANPRLEVLDPSYFTLKDSDGRDVVPAVGSSWTSSDTSVLAGPLPWFSYPRVAAFSPRKPGVVDLTFENGVTREKTTTKVTVVGSYRGTLNGSAPMSYKYCSGVRLSVSGPWTVRLSPTESVFDFLGGITQTIRANPCFTNVAVFKDTIPLVPVAGSSTEYQGYKLYPFVGDEGASAGTQVYVYVTLTSTGITGRIVWVHYNASLVGEVRADLILSN